MGGLTSIDVSNVLSEEKRNKSSRWGGRCGVSSKKQETGIRRETAGAYLKAAGVAIRAPGGWGRRSPAKPANDVSPDSTAAFPAWSDQNRPTVSPDSEPAPLPGRRPTGSACEPYFDFIEVSIGKRRNAKAIYQDLVDSHGFTGRYASVKRFVGQLRGQPAKSACAVIVTPHAEEAQVDYGSGPMSAIRTLAATGEHVCSYSRWGYSRRKWPLLSYLERTQPKAVTSKTKLF